MLEPQNFPTTMESPPPLCGLIDIRRVRPVPEMFSDGEFGTLR